MRSGTICDPWTLDGAVAIEGAFTGGSRERVGPQNQSY
jgi:hypothetical protein